MTCRDCSLFLCAIFSVILISAADDEQFKLVEISQGLVKGYMNSGVYAFYGIPYASAPRGSSKFKSSMPGPSWPDTFEAVHNDVFCPQVIGYANVTEDCLVANVFLPDTEETGLSVVVYVHGGGFILTNSNQRTPLAVVKEGNVIVVSGNYRLSAYGFLCLGTDAVPGNAAIKDIIALLEWVKSNIADFGGNPDDVTLSGFSAGAALVSLVMLTEAADGLYNKVIIESGSGYSGWGMAMDPMESAAAFAKLAGIDTRDVSVLEEFYLNLPEDQLRDNNSGLIDGSLYFAPCVEQQATTGAVVLDAPHNILQRGSFSKVPILVSITDMEGLFRTNLMESMIEGMNENFSDFLPADLQFESQEIKVEVARTVKEFYFGTEPVGNHSLMGFIHFQSDVMFSQGVLRLVQGLIDAGNEEVYLYLYTYSEPDALGASHCAQTAAIYDETSFTPDESNISESRQQIKRTIRDIWFNFVKSGKPVPEASAAYPSGWPSAGAGRSPYMEMTLPPRLHHDRLLQDRFAFWDQIYERHIRVPVPPPGSDTQTTINAGKRNLIPTYMLIIVLFYVTYSQNEWV